MKSKLKIGAAFVTRGGTTGIICDITDRRVHVRVVGGDEVEKIAIKQAIEYVEDGWWKFIINPNEIWKELNEA